MTERTLTLGYTPPSLNRIAGTGSRWRWSSAKASLQRDLELLLMAERIPRPVDHVAASARLAFTTSRRRDEGNFRALLEKSLGDALTNGGWLVDDTPEHYQFGGVVFDRGPVGTFVTVVWSGR